MIPRLADLRLGARLSLAFGALALILVAVAAGGFVHLDRLNGAQARKIADLQERAERVHAVAQEFAGISQAVHAALVVDGKEAVARELGRIEGGKRRVSEMLEILDKGFAGEQASGELQSVHDRNGVYLISLTKFTRLLAADRRQDAVTLLNSELRPKLDEALDAMQGLVWAQGRLMEQSREGAAAAYRSARNATLVAGLAAMALAVVLAGWLARRITAPLLEAVRLAGQVAEGDLTSQVMARSGDETGRLVAALATMNQSLTGIVLNVRGGAEAIATASGELLAGNTNLLQRTEEQATALEESASSMQELTATVKQTAEHAKQANALARDAASVAQRGGEVMRAVVKTMDAIHVSANKVEDIIGVINGIAFQTNILALNAAVEAARAGEQGRGFAVVASEVRALAQRSAVAAKEIKALIGTSAASVGEGAALVASAGRTMEEIVQSIGRVDALVGQISSATQEQSNGIEQVNEALVQMEKITQQNSALAEQSAAAVESLEDQSRMLVKTVGVFKLNGAGVPPLAAPAAQQRLDWRGA